MLASKKQKQKNDNNKPTDTEYGRESASHGERGANCEQMVPGSKGQIRGLIASVAQSRTPSVGRYARGETLAAGASPGTQSGWIFNGIWGISLEHEQSGISEPAASEPQLNNQTLSASYKADPIINSIPLFIAKSSRTAPHRTQVPGQAMSNSKSAKPSSADHPHPRMPPLWNPLYAFPQLPAPSPPAHVSTELQRLAAPWQDHSSSLDIACLQISWHGQ